MVLLGDGEKDGSLVHDDESRDDWQEWPINQEEGASKDSDDDDKDEEQEDGEEVVSTGAGKSAPLRGHESEHASIERSSSGRTSHPNKRNFCCRGYYGVWGRHGLVKNS